jgi:glutamate/tyrosine decarboxylase-like PLP-dependent enzyme
VAADWLTSAWDQNVGLHVMSPSAAAAEQTVATWVKELLGLPAGAGVGLVSGAQMANVTALAAARNAVLAGAGWDVEEYGLAGSPPLRVITSAESHATLFNALRLLGLGRGTALRVAADEQGRMRADELVRALGRGGSPTIVCAQAGNVNTGAFDPLAEIVAACRAAGAWCHIDGAFGLWAAAAPGRAHLAAGVEGADSWAVDAHKWLNVPYESALAIVADPGPLTAAMRLTAAYLTTAAERERNGADWAPEASRRARAFPLYAALRGLGRRGVGELVERDCALASRIAERLAREDGVQVLNDVVLNQVLARFGDDDAATAAVIERVQRDGTCWLGGTNWHGKGAMRISISGWQTTADDIDRSAEAIAAAWRAQRAG